jgi:hypothetical protein
MWQHKDSLHAKYSYMKVMWQRNQKICEYGICSNFSQSKRGSHIFNSNFSPWRMLMAETLLYFWELNEHGIRKWKKKTR